MHNDLPYQIGFCLFAAIFGLPIYFAPTIIAIRNQRRVGLTLFTNLFLGWTGLGYFMAFALATQR